MEPIQGVIQVLEQLLMRHQELLALEQKKERVLIEDRIQELVSILHDESKLLKRIAELDHERKHWAGQVFASKGLKEDSYTLSDLIQLITSHQDKETVKHFHRRLSDVIAELQEQNRLNQQLIGQSLDYINQTLSLITEGPLAQPTYHKEAASAPKSPGPVRSFFDKKA